MRIMNSREMLIKKKTPVIIIKGKSQDIFVVTNLLALSETDEDFLDHLSVESPKIIGQGFVPVYLLHYQEKFTFIQLQISLIILHISSDVMMCYFINDAKMRPLSAKKKCDLYATLGLLWHITLSKREHSFVVCFVWVFLVVKPLIAE